MATVIEHWTGACARDWAYWPSSDGISCCWPFSGDVNFPVPRYYAGHVYFYDKGEFAREVLPCAPSIARLVNIVYELGRVSDGVRKASSSVTTEKIMFLHLQAYKAVDAFPCPGHFDFVAPQVAAILKGLPRLRIADDLKASIRQIIEAIDGECKEMKLVPVTELQCSK